MASEQQLFGICMGKHNKQPFEMMSVNTLILMTLKYHCCFISGVSNNEQVEHFKVPLCIYLTCA